MQGKTPTKTNSFFGKTQLWSAWFGWRAAADSQRDVQTPGGILVPLFPALLPLSVPPYPLQSPSLPSPPPPPRLLPAAGVAGGEKPLDVRSNVFLEKLPRWGLNLQGCGTWGRGTVPGNVWIRCSLRVFAA